MIINENAKILKHQKLAPQIYSLWLNSPSIARKASPGQFVMIKLPPTPGIFLRRPFSIADVKYNDFLIIYKVVGKGTKRLSKMKINGTLEVLGPLGKKIRVYKNQKILLCAGGLGIAPLYFLIKELHSQNELYLYYGTRSKKELINPQLFTTFCKEVLITTNDGSYGNKGLITDYLDINELRKKRISTIYAAGPLAMLKKLKDMFLDDLKFKIYGFLESPMGCGCGLCFSCGVKNNNGRYLRICTDGPVFNLREVNVDSLAEINHDS
jgi:dihydroorotate dehydrogenase electron transfer subunit